MRLVGFRIEHGEDPLDEGYVPLGDLSVLVGANDAGKSRLLAALHNGLTGQAEPVEESLSFVLEVSAAELDVIVGHAGGALLRDDEIEPPGEEDEGLARRAGWNGAFITADNDVLLDSDAGTKHLLTILRERCPEPARAWSVIIDALSHSVTLSARRAHTPTPDPNARWQLTWCLPAAAGTDETLRAALTEVGLPLREDGGPTPMAPIGALDLPVMPRPVAVPTSFDIVSRTVEQAITRLVLHTKEALTARVEGLDGSLLWTPSEGDRALVDEDYKTGTVSMHPDVHRSAEHIGRVADSLLPRFLQHRYRVVVHVRRLLDWREGRRIELQLEDRATAQRFPMEDVAQGHRLWLQLALFEAADDLDLARSTLEVLLERDLPLFEDAWERAREELEADEATKDEIVDGYAVARASGHHLYVDAVERFRSGQLESMSADLPVIADEMASFRWSDSALTWAPGRQLLEQARTPVYVIDEPEQHLNPRLQREAAIWLRDFLQQRRSQAVLVTHAPAFLNLGNTAQVLYVRRPTGGVTEVTPISTTSLRSLDEAAIDIGLDRGELLTMTSVLLFVEGRAEQRILEALFGHRLASAGITVVPIHGANRAVGIIEAETLMRFTTARLAVWLDNVPAPLLRRMRDDLGFAAEVKSNKAKMYSSEQKTMADLLLIAAQTSRDIEPLPHPGADVFDLLDDATIRRLHPAYPGHARAAADMHAQRAKGNNDWKGRYRKLYGLNITAEFLEQVARAMLRDGTCPAAEMEEVIFTCERLAIGLGAVKQQTRDAAAP